ncbi:aldehyde dehydrogenase family protein [Amycolatopsis pithecellobii]|uniref:Aldehyde dehydrogenase family protein n=1 Tax=Amycolatopsis pithecellobii TaxID=664692 RepID=A0A6N7Z1V8_9PSEU|nr:aldehyde dehydrogenase family protein [Amycolatopsis pithecellobii]MTD53730.1 aldehyde dehydrogenase family protein [Amycolatopsis pithecellobii]
MNDTVLADNQARAQEMLATQWQLFLDGGLRDAQNGATFDVVSPHAEQVIAQVPNASVDDADAAVAAATRAWPSWAAMPPTERAKYVSQIASIIEANRDDLALLDAVDGGAPIGIMAMDVNHSAAVCRYFAGLALETKGYSVPLTTGTHFTVREPYGVVAAIVPFNHPILFAVTKLAAPLVAGNCVILKPAEATPLSALWLGKLLSDVFPPGVVQILTGDGPTVPSRLVKHPDVTRISFTGSEQTGRRILRDAADTGVKEVSLELGGKNAMVVYPDADPQEVADAAFRGMNFAWSGQSCGSTSRLVIHETLADKVLNLMVDRLQGRRIGNPVDPSNEQGPMVDKRQFDRVTGFVSEAVEQGARVVCGGGTPATAQHGYYFEPTILDGVDTTDRVAVEEIFGPVLSVIRWNDGDDPVDIANSVRYGLTGSVFSNDVRLALRAAKRIRAGYIWINGSARHFIGMPFGGYKASGLGREESIEELLSYTQVKSIHIVDEVTS